MAGGRGRARTAEAERVAGTEQLGGQVEQPDKTAQLEQPEKTAQDGAFDAADSWEPVVPDTWAVPAEQIEPTELPDVPSESPSGSAGWTDAARSEEEWVDAARHSGAPPAEVDKAGVDETGPVPYLESIAAQYLGDEPVPTGHPRTAATAPAPPADEERGPNGPRMALGLATMAAQRLRGSVPAGDVFVTGVGLAQETANGLRELGRRVLGPTTRMAAEAVRGAAWHPVAGAPVRVVLRAGDRLAEAAALARIRGQVTVEAGRAEAQRLLRERLDRALRWATDRAVTPLAERLAPQVAERVLPHVVAEVADRVTGGGDAQERGAR